MLRLRPDWPFAPERFSFFYGFVIVVAATAGILMSIPGQTMGVSVFTDPLIDATGLSRFELSNVYLVGTVASGLLLPAGGRLLDRYGARVTGIAAALGLGATLVFLSGIDRMAHPLARGLELPPAAVAAVLLGAGFTSLRFSGQGMLTMVSRTMLARWWSHYRGRISALSGLFVSFGFASAPLLLHAWIAAAGWRGAWLGMAVAVGVGMSLVVLVFYRETPEDSGLAMDGRGEPSEGEAPATVGALEELAVTRADAIRSLPFWAVTGSLANQALVITAVTFHIVDIGSENGLDAGAAVAIFLPVAVVSTSFGFLVGWAADRSPIRNLIIIQCLAQAVGFAAVAHLGDPALRVVAILGWGGASSFFGPLSVAALPRFFGRLHLGAISSVQMSALVVASAVGPSMLAASREWLGSYAPALYGSCVLPLAVVVLAILMQEPPPAKPR